MRGSDRFKKAILAMVMASVFVGMTFGQAIKSDASKGKINISMLGKYDSADTATIRSVDTEAREIRFKNHTTGKIYTLKYDNTSMMYDQYGTVLSAGRLEPGQIVDVKLGNLFYIYADNNDIICFQGRMVHRQHKESRPCEKRWDCSS